MLQRTGKDSQKLVTSAGNFDTLHQQRKIRCDGGLPCSPCIKSNQGHCCSYETRAKKRGIALSYSALFGQIAYSNKLEF
ncbi:hypothetical protein BKA69DRAFT_1078402 [Paraphysoderma sedebokerense]|nr:hypothetical protein BKA69DRAFT_1078402 [Paraphysoderma sedebokerense]